MFYYYHHIGDFRAATAFLPDNLQYAYLKLLWVYYDTEEPLPNNPAKLALWAGVSQDQVLLIMDEFFDLDDGAWHHARCDEGIDKYQVKADSARSAGKKRWKKTDLKSDQTSEADQIRLPIVTNNQQPITSTALPKKKVERTGKTGKRFVPPTLDQVKERFREKNLNGDPEHFFDHHTNADWKLSGGKGAKMKSWKLAANTWSRNQRIFDPKSGGHKDGKLVLPRDRDGWQQFAEIHKLPKAQAGESFDAWGGRLRSEIDRRHNP